MNPEQMTRLVFLGPGGGTGMGLATSYGIVRSHRGAIECESAVGQGAVFRIYLPSSVSASGLKDDPSTTNKDP